MKTLSTGILFGLFGAVAVSVAVAAQWPTWVMFIAWVSYYIFGKSIQSSSVAFLQILLGIIMGILIQTIGIFLTEFLGGIGFPITVFFFIGSLAFISKIKALANIPAWFLGLIVFFGVHPEIAPVPLLSIAMPLVAGLLFAWANDTAVHQPMLFKKRV